MAGIQIDGVNNKIDFDDDLDTSISANTDDTLVIEAGGNTMATITATTLTINDGTTITTADNTDTLTLISTDADANVGPNLRLYRNSSSPAQNDLLGNIQWEGRNNNSQDVIYAEMRAQIETTTDGSEDANFKWSTMIGGTLVDRLAINANATVFNEDSVDVDFRVESNGLTHALFVDAGNDRVGIGTSAPVVPLSVRAAQEQLTLSEGDARGATFDYRSSTGNLNITTNGGNARSAPQLALHLNGVLSATAGVALGVGAANTASNVLDDYEEGTFTPDFDDSSNNSPTSMTAAQGFYTKVGRLVTVQIYVEVNSKGSGMNGNVMRISNLPFTPVSNLQNQSMAVSYISNLDVNNLPVGAAVYSNNSFIYLYYISGDNSAQITPGMIADGTRLAVGGSYMST